MLVLLGLVLISCRNTLIVLLTCLVRVSSRFSVQRTCGRLGRLVRLVWQVVLVWLAWLCWVVTLVLSN